MKNSLKFGVVGVIASFLLVGCGGPGHISVHDTMNSAGGSNDAHISMEANSCDGIDNSTGSLSIKDLSAIDFESVGGVHFSGNVESTYFCSSALDFDAPMCACGEGYQEINFSYKSKNPKVSGNGTGIACMADLGDNGDAKKQGGVGGIAVIRVDTGPYSGYYNVGSAGVTQHTCI